ncbi:TIGR01244 family sulfur transferase [Nioella aestuarii]|uniref:TIGR01244 family sulfur transferase n=1 Tax=Nioella aestuarii TaxID=1662864 RepID=UPI003D7F9324
MDLRPLSEDHSVAGQLDPADMAELAAQGVTTVICNRPDMEVPPSHQAAAMQAAAEAAGLAFVYNPVNGAAMTMDNVEEQAEALDSAQGASVAYCASGMRSSVMWAFSQAGQIATDDIIAAAGAAGYQLEGMRGQIDALAAREG